MPVHVMVKRKLQIRNPEQLLPLLNELRARAKEQPGYIDGQTLRNLEDPAEYIVISTWVTSDDWKTWMQSKDRRDIQGKIDSLIGERTFYEIFEPVSH